MKYSLQQLTADIIDYLEDEMTIFNNVIFDYDDYGVRVNGRVSQYYEYTPPDALNPPWKDLVARSSDFDEVIISGEDDERAFTIEELYELEEMIDEI